MPKLIFINLPVADLDRSIAFYGAIGAVKDGRFSDATAACMTLSETIHVMLLTYDKFRQFATKPIADPRAGSQTLISVSAESRAEVDAVTEKAGAAGGVMDPSPIDDYGFMYGRSFEDPDGHAWGITWMDVSQMPQS